MARSNRYLGSVSDLMAGLMIVFLFIAISYMVEVRTSEQQVSERATDLEKAVADLEKAKKNTDSLNATIREIAATYSEIQSSLYQALEKEFHDDLKRWKATLEPDNTIRFNEPDVLFLTGNKEIRPKFEQILSDFFPRYTHIIYNKKYQNEISEIRIEGHTSSRWDGESTREGRYLKNARLSQQRALSVLQFCFELSAISDQQRSLLIRDLRANGLSFSRSIMIAEGKEDESRSQRVEFRVVTKTKEKILQIIETTVDSETPTKAPINGSN